jgi:hypothetical protein
MNIIKSITPLLNLIGIDTGRETAVGAPSATRPIIQRPVVIVIQQPQRQPAIRERCDGSGRQFVNYDGSPASPEQIARYYAGEFDIVDTAPELPRQSWER